ncbi:hypothetical protein G6F50_018582 [Rhizopus delemar]|uniref:Uncharacterized protein n=1 Tax=Rhizopus delemar TaxID=936053 RepID=A0A9P6XM58_9FUNG|nr:hypothetical protein G6F50_018582 [Rhizopus delemar]
MARLYKSTAVEQARLHEERRAWPPQKTPALAGVSVTTGLTGSIRSSCRRRLHPARRPGRPRRGVRRSWSAPARPAVP